MFLPRSNGMRAVPQHLVQYDLSGNVDVVVKGGHWHLLGDAVFYLLRVSWLGFVAWLFTLYSCIIIMFALLFWSGEDLLLNLVTGEPCTFRESLQFSLVTLSTIGYGNIIPQSEYCVVLVTLQFYVALFAGTISSGILFSRVSTPRARICFSSNVVVSTKRGVPTVCFRAVNERASSCLLNAKCRVSALVKDPDMGMRILSPCALTRDTNLMFRVVWNVMHLLDERSPIEGINAQNVEDKLLALVVLIEGNDQTYGSVVFASKCYYPSDFLFDCEFDDIMQMKDSTIFVDLPRISSTHRVLATPLSHLKVCEDDTEEEPETCQCAADLCVVQECDCTSAEL
eukprot:TRINITY_DN8463_c0_g1_i2.p1 TRINITY_DN8463_c0_g1~~TRINITY_DN8463_c0_g1_i2.p1  ORF type:complete len:361 (-),score=12.99 TRINITY_DN8463_c0_g1_i2:51-1073(-)